MQKKRPNKKNQCKLLNLDGFYTVLWLRSMDVSSLFWILISRAASSLSGCSSAILLRLLKRPLQLNFVPARLCEAQFLALLIRYWWLTLWFFLPSIPSLWYLVVRRQVPEHIWSLGLPSSVCIWSPSFFLLIFFRVVRFSVFVWFLWWFLNLQYVIVLIQIICSK